MGGTVSSVQTKVDVGNSTCFLLENDGNSAATQLFCIRADRLDDSNRIKAKLFINATAVSEDFLNSTIMFNGHGSTPVNKVITGEDWEDIKDDDGNIVLSEVTINANQLGSVKMDQVNIGFSGPNDFLHLDRVAYTFFPVEDIEEDDPIVRLSFIGNVGINNRYDGT